MSFSKSEEAGLLRRGFTVTNNMAEITSGGITVAVVGRGTDGLFQLIIKLPTGTEILCSASPTETVG